MDVLVTVVLVIVVALVFDFTNGFHDTAEAIYGIWMTIPGFH